MFSVSHWLVHNFGQRVTVLRLAQQQTVRYWHVSAGRVGHEATRSGSSCQELFCPMCKLINIWMDGRLTSLLSNFVSLGRGRKRMEGWVSSRGNVLSEGGQDNRGRGPWWLLEASGWSGACWTWMATCLTVDILNWRYWVRLEFVVLRPARKWHSLQLNTLGWYTWHA